MSTDLLYHGWGLGGYQHRFTSFTPGGICFVIEPDPDTFCCSACGATAVERAGVVVRWFKCLPIGTQAVTLKLAVQRLRCHRCGLTRQARLGFADPQRSYTRAFEHYALGLSRHMTLQAVARHLQVSWDTIKDIQKRHLQTHYAKPKLGHLRQLAIDEISIGRHHRYLTVVLDLASGAVVFVGEGKGAETLRPFWRKLRRAKATIQAVATDMSPAYTLAVREHLPEAVHVFDRFHVLKLVNTELAELRREVQRQAAKEDQQVLKRTQWLLLKNPEHLRPTRNERARLATALRLNAPLATAYYLKEDLRTQFWAQRTQAAAARFLDDWLARAQASGIRRMQKLAKTLQRHRAGLLNWYRYRITTGPLEGTNNKIKTMQRQAYGYRDAEFFKLKIYALHQTTYALVG